MLSIDKIPMTTSKTSILTGDVCFGAERCDFFLINVGVASPFCLPYGGRMLQMRCWNLILLVRHFFTAPPYFEHGIVLGGIDEISFVDLEVRSFSSDHPDEWSCPPLDAGKHMLNLDMHF